MGVGSGVYRGKHHSVTVTKRPLAYIAGLAARDLIEHMFTNC